MLEGSSPSCLGNRSAWTGTGTGKGNERDGPGDRRGHTHRAPEPQCLLYPKAHRGVTQKPPNSVGRHQRQLLYSKCGGCLFRAEPTLKEANHRPSALSYKGPEPRSITWWSRKIQKLYRRLQRHARPHLGRCPSTPHLTQSLRQLSSAQVNGAVSTSLALSASASG